jgi:hypothetical protein
MMFPPFSRIRKRLCLLCVAAGFLQTVAHAAVLLSTGFETDPWASGWTTNGVGSATWTTTQFASGTHAIAASNSTWITPFLNTTPLQWYRLAFKSKAPGVANNAGSAGYGYWASVFFDANGNRLNDDQYSSVFASSNWVTNEFRIRAKHTAGANASLVPARMKVLFQALDAPLYIDDVMIEPTTPDEVVRWADTFYDSLPAKLNYVPKATRWSRLPLTMQRLRQAQPLRIVMLGDSVQQDMANAPIDALLRRLYPGAPLELISSTRGGTGVQYYKDHVPEFVLAYRPDLLVIGGISHEDNLAAWQSVVAQVRADDAIRARTTEILILTRQWSPNNAGTYFLAPGLTELDPVPANNAVIPNDVRGHLLTFCATNNIEFLDMTGIASQFIYGPATAAGVGAPVDESGAPYSYWLRDYVHSNDRAKMILGRTLEAYFAPRPKLSVTTAGSQARLAWPLAATGYHLETSTAMGTNSTWVSNAAVIAVTNGYNVVTQKLSAATNRIFYRLRQG